jgi:Sec-independent protein translocase protein TatA
MKGLGTAIKEFKNATNAEDEKNKEKNKEKE